MRITQQENHYRQNGRSQQLAGQDWASLAILVAALRSANDIAVRAEDRLALEVMHQQREDQEGCWPS